MKKFNYLLILVIFLSNNLYAKESEIIEPLAQNTLMLKAVEYTNLETKGYIWQLRLKPNSDQRSIQVELLNPHAKFFALNQRAIEIAQTYKFEHLATFSYQTKMNQEMLNKDTGKSILTHPMSSTPQPDYILQIRFPHGIAWKRKPSISSISRYIDQYCQMSTDDPRYSTDAFIHELHPEYQFEFFMNVHASGIIDNIELKNPSKNKKINDILLQNFKKSSFYPLNENGIPTDFKTQQPITLSCK